MNLIENTIEVLEVDPDFVVKNKTIKSPEITARQLIERVVLDGGNTKAIELFKGHDQTKVREAFSLTFYQKPKPSRSTEWYLHILNLNGLKKCPSCGEIKDIALFSKNKAMLSSGVDSWCLECMREYRAINKDMVAKTKLKWQRENRDKVNSTAAKYRASKIQAIPNWADLERIKEIYAKCPEGYHVDHWAPLQGSSVCGLHVEHNLQYIEAKDNIAKSNFFSDGDIFYGTSI
jgi:hypothetical protein